MYSFPLDSNCLMGGFWVLFLLIHLLRLQGWGVTASMNS